MTLPIAVDIPANRVSPNAIHTGSIIGSYGLRSGEAFSNPDVKFRSFYGEKIGFAGSFRMMDKMAQIMVKPRAIFSG
jgi:hypothetical protein